MLPTFVMLVGPLDQGLIAQIEKKYRITEKYQCLGKNGGVRIINNVKRIGWFKRGLLIVNEEDFILHFTDLCQLGHRSVVIIYFDNPLKVTKEACDYSRFALILGVDGQDALCDFFKFPLSERPAKGKWGLIYHLGKRAPRRITV